MSTETHNPKGGPRTAEGRARSSVNALKHGLFSKKIVLECEDQAEFDALLNGYVTEYCPATPIECGLVREITASRWRLERVEGIETALFNAILARHHDETGDPDPYAGLASAFTPGTDATKSLKLVHLYEGRLRRAYERALLRLKEHRTAQPAAQPQPQPQPAAAPDPKPAPAPSSNFQLSDLLKDPGFGTDHLFDSNGKLNPKTASFISEAFKSERDCEARRLKTANTK